MHTYAFFLVDVMKAPWVDDHLSVKMDSTQGIQWNDSLVEVWLLINDIILRLWWHRKRYPPKVSLISYCLIIEYQREISQDLSWTHHLEDIKASSDRTTYVDATKNPRPPPGHIHTIQPQA